MAAHLRIVRFVLRTVCLPSAVADVRPVQVFHARPLLVVDPRVYGYNIPPMVPTMGTFNPYVGGPVILPYPPAFAPPPRPQALDAESVKAKITWAGHLERTAVI